MSFHSLALAPRAMPAPSRTLPGTIDAAYQGEILSEALVSEVHRVALYTATFTSGINSMGDAALNFTVKDLAAFLPGEPASLNTLKNLLVETDFRHDEFLFLAEYLQGIGAGRRMFEAYLEDAVDIGQSRAAVIHRAGLGSAWRQTCRLGLLALEELDAHIAPDLPEVHVQNSRVIGALLTGANNGLCPCIDCGGRLYLPPTPQQRRWPRRSLLQTCTFTYRDRVIEAFVRDISAGGLGLERVPPLARGTTVEIELESGRRLHGAVAWSSASIAGVSFKSHLAPDDPLLLG